MEFYEGDRVTVTETDGTRRSGVAGESGTVTSVDPTALAFKYRVVLDGKYGAIWIGAEFLTPEKDPAPSSSPRLFNEGDRVRALGTSYNDWLGVIGLCGTVRGFSSDPNRYLVAFDGHPRYWVEETDIVFLPVNVAETETETTADDAVTVALLAVLRDVKGKPCATRQVKAALYTHVLEAIAAGAADPAGLAAAALEAERI